MKQLFLILLLAFSFSAVAQNNGSISGNVFDKKLNENVPYVTITIKENDQIITGVLTDDSGNFTVKSLAPKNYTVEVSFIGYKTYTTTADLTQQKDLDLDRISLEDESYLLEGVEVVREVSTIEQKIDRKVINVGRDLLTAGATASEIMNNIPTVNVDQDGNISLRGNQNVRVLIDGKPTHLDPKTLLKQIPSNSIDKIELITNPSAKYNPEGMSGMINFVLKKNMQDGFNGSYNGNITFAKVPKFNQGIDLNYRKGKVNFFGNYNYSDQKTFNNGI